MFTGIHFRIGSWTVTEHNFIGIFLAMLSVIVLTISYFFLHNLTKDKTFDLYLKREVLGDDETEIKEKEKADQSKPQRLWTTKDIATNWNVMFLFMTDAFLAYAFAQMDLVITMTAVKVYHWSILHFGILTAVSVLNVSLILYYTQKKLLGNGRNMYFLFIFCFVFIALFTSYLNMMLAMDWKSFYWQTTTLFIAHFINSIQAIGSTAFSRWLIYSSTPSHSASIIESHRFMYCRVWASVGFFTSSYAFQWIWLVLPVTTCVSIIIVVLFVKKKDDYIKKK